MSDKLTEKLQELLELLFATKISQSLLNIVISLPSVYHLVPHIDRQGVAPEPGSEGPLVGGAGLCGERVVPWGTGCQERGPLTRQEISPRLLHDD